MVFEGTTGVGLESGMVFEGTTGVGLESGMVFEGVYDRIYRFNSS